MTPQDEPAISAGVRWAVINAFARSLPAGLYRANLRLLALGMRPLIGRQGAALVEAADLGLLNAGNITPEGAALASSLLEDAPNFSATQPDPEAMATRELFRPYSDHLAQFLAMEIPSVEIRERLGVCHTEVKALVDGAPYTDLNVLSLIQAVAYVEGGINLATGGAV